MGDDYADLMAEDDLLQNVNTNFSPPHERPSRFVGKFNTLKGTESYRQTKAEVAAGVPLSSASENDSGPSTSTDGSSAPIVAKAHSAHVLLVNPKQRGNPALKAVSNIPWEYDETIPADYVMGASSCALFLSVRYHNLNPDYIHDRLKQLGNKFELRVLLVQVDTPDPHHALKHLTRICILANLTLVLAWSAEEAGRILETYKMFEHKPPDLIMERKESDPHQKIVGALTSVRSVNKTDASTLLTTFGSLEKIIKSSSDTLALCPGLGPTKAKRFHSVLHQPFIRETKPKGSKAKKT